MAWLSNEILHACTLDWRWQLPVKILQFHISLMYMCTSSRAHLCIPLCNIVPCKSPGALQARYIVAIACSSIMKLQSFDHEAADLYCKKNLNTHQNDSTQIELRRLILGLIHEAEAADLIAS